VSAPCLIHKNDATAITNDGTLVVTVGSEPILGEINRVALDRIQSRTHDFPQVRVFKHCARLLQL